MQLLAGIELIDGALLIVTSSNFCRELALLCKNEVG
jgi:hypothetical protein